MTTSNWEYTTPIGTRWEHLSTTGKRRAETVMSSDTFWKYRGYIIWSFDGYFDVQTDMDSDPLGTFSTVEEARAFINEQRKLRATFGLSKNF